MYKTAILSLFMLFAYSTTAQEVQIELEKGFKLESIETITDVGFVCVLKTGNPSNKENDLKYQFYDDNLELVKNELIHHEKYTMEWESFETDDYDHQIYAVRSGKLVIRSIAKHSLEMINTEIVLPKGARVITVDHQGDFVLCVMYKGAERGVFKMNWRTGESEFFPFQLEGLERMKFIGIKVISQGDIFVIARAEVKNVYSIHAIHLSPLGEQAETTVIAHEKLLLAEMEEIAENAFLFAGVYSTGNQYRSEGLVFTSASNGEVMNEKTVTYSSIPDFNTLSGTSANKGYYVGDLEVIKTESGSMVIGEACYPINHRNHNNELIFDYYQFTHGFVCVLDEEGELTWSATFKDGFRHFSLDISESYLVVTEEDAETYILRNPKSGSIHEVNLTDNVITTIDKEEATTAKKPRINFDPTLYDGLKMWGKDAILVYKKEKVKTDDGKKMILTVTKISR